MPSLRTIAEWMDAAEPVLSLRELHRLHRDAGQTAPSLRELVARHAHPHRSDHRLLSYNTYLLPGVTLPWNQWFNHILATDPTAVRGIFTALHLSLGQALAEYMAKKGVGVSDLLGILNLNPVSILKNFGKALGAPDELMALVGVLDVVTGRTLVERALDWIVSVTAGQPSALIALLKLDPITVLTKLLDHFGVGIKEFLEVLGVTLPSAPGVKPALHDRATEIGDVLVGYDIVCLSEVFGADERHAALAGLAAQAGYEEHVGPGAVTDWVTLGSGLATALVGAGRSITGREAATYEHKGNEFQDSDWWSSKGVTLTRLALGVGRVELYATHLHSGGEFIAAEPSDADKLTVRLAQVAELRAFVARHHRPDHLAIVVGDFNIDATDAEAYDALTGYFRDISCDSGVTITLNDLWPWQRGHDVIGHTNDGAKGSEAPYRFCATCRGCDADLSAAPTALKQHRDAYCVETLPLQPGADLPGDRIDYIFVQEGSPAHAFTVDFSRMWRRYFPRANPTFDEHFLSDHLGLETTMRITPRA